MTISPLIFRAYDIRGKANSQITEDACYLIGKGFGSILREKYGKESPTVAVGRDMRTHSPAFEKAVIQGLIESGCTVLNIGQTPSPVNYFTICTQNIDAGVQITASHNPAEDNGLKLQVREAEAFSGDNLQTLRKRIDAENFLEGEGSVEEIDAITPYKNHLLEMFKDIGNGLNVVVDNGNGVSGPSYNDILKSVGCSVTELFAEPDGTFPNHPADPSKWETLKDLQKTVQKEKADVGIAFDGDGDRIGFVDENGEIKTADDILLLLAEEHLKRNKGAPIIFTVSNSSTLQTEIEKWGGHPIMCMVGHSFVEHAMRESNSHLGGEQSGHFFCFEDYYKFDDALIAALHVLKILSESGKPFSKLFSNFPKVFQAPELRPNCPDEHKTRIIKEITEHFQKDFPVNTLDGARIDFGYGAWAGIRQSNTSPKISICIEARSEEKLKEIEGFILTHLKTYPEIGL
ncbi:phosphomannomutase/phosphoglucomutase [Patescibacteria group bacterium]|nr:phosphomannomutase/phosphoglucomutase [Patescibacteria group bacterium]